MMRFAFALLLSFCGASVTAAPAEFGAFNRVEFSPARKESFVIPVKLNAPATIEVMIYTSDDDLVASVRSSGMLRAGLHQLVWDGRDAEGNVVPDEAYVPVLVAIDDKGGRTVVDPRSTSGGEVVSPAPKVATSREGISYSLPAAARVLVRAGIRDGPMLASLASWEPRTPGRNIHRWSGFDADNLRDLRDNPRLTILVTAFKLPDHSIITIGNGELDYRTYRLKRGFAPKALPAEVKLERNGQRIARNFYMPQYARHDPAVTLKVSGHAGTAADGTPIVKEKVTLHVDIPARDRWLVEESQYEVAFFLNNEFLSEEERGFVPISWVWAPAGVPPGRHMLTVNISGFGGKVGVKSVIVEVAK
jgi:hypothetical protein